MYRARRSEARIQQMLWKLNYSDIVFINTVCDAVDVIVRGAFITIFTICGSCRLSHILYYTCDVHRCTISL